MNKNLYIPFYFFFFCLQYLWWKFYALIVDNFSVKTFDTYVSKLTKVESFSSTIFQHTFATYKIYFQCFISKTIYRTIAIY